MFTARRLLPAALAAGAVGLALPAHAAVTVDAHGAFVDGPEAPADRTAPAPRHGPAVVKSAERDTNLRKAETFVAVLGPRTLR